MCQLFCLLFDAVSTIEDRLQILTPFKSKRVNEFVKSRSKRRRSLEETFAAASFSHFDFSLFSTSCVIESAAIDAGGWWRRVARVSYPLTFTCSSGRPLLLVERWRYLIAAHFQHIFLVPHCTTCPTSRQPPPPTPQQHMPTP